MLTRHAGTWTIEDRCESILHYLPLEVPAGSTALRVSLDFDADGTVLDLGCFGPAGFRGWSGGARRSFVIGAQAATPGYLPGELEPGVWHAVLGLHRIPASGAQYELTAEPTARPRAARRRPDALAGRRPARPYRSFRRPDDGARAGQVRGQPRPGLPRGDRPQHDQPPRRAASGRGRLRHHAAAR